MKINNLKIIPKDWIVEKYNHNLQINYKNKRPQNSPKKGIIISKFMFLDEHFYEGLGLFLGDADIHRIEKGHLTFCNKDKDICIFAKKWLEKYFLIDNDYLTILIQYKNDNPHLIEDWAKLLNFPKNRILKRYSSRHKNETMQLQVNSVVFRKYFEIILKESLEKNFRDNSLLRSAFLRGIFAAEGNIGIDYKEKKPYISQISFNLNINEKDLQEIICSILKKEGITFKIYKRLNKNSLEIIIQNWNNYWKLYNIKTFELCLRKKTNFNAILNELKVYPLISKELINFLFYKTNLTQKELAKKLNTYQGNISKISSGNMCLNLNQFNIIISHINLNKKLILNKIKALRIGNLTIIEDPRFKEFMFNQ
mgnify:CR=1 FL=1